MNSRNYKFAKNTIIACSIILAMGLVSWGGVGHKTIGQIAENHLTAQAKSNVMVYLGDKSMSDLASWADEVRNQPEYKQTAPWHFINLPLGLSHEAFVKAVMEQTQDNVYSALLKCEHDLVAPNASFDQKAVALKFIIHFVGDLHQPMHFSRAEDKGGNTIQVQYDGKGTNLHSLWDSNLLEHQGQSYTELATAFDKATPDEIKQWQSTDPIEWCYESYVITNDLYAEVAKNNAIDDAYYNAHIGIIQKRIDQAGIRLAGILNKAFPAFLVKNALLAPNATVSNPALTVNKIKAEELSKHIGETVSLTTTVYGTKDVGSMVLVNCGAAYPNQIFTLVLRGDAKSLAISIDTKTIRISGTVVDYKGKPEIVISDPKQIEGVPTH